jgi:hypothetical protein
MQGYLRFQQSLQVPKEINDANDLDEKNGNQLWEEAMKTQLDHHIDYQTFIVLDSGQDIPHPMVFLSN